MHLEYKRGILQFVFQLFLRELKGNKSSKLICFYNSNAWNNNIALYTINIPEIMVSNLSIYTLYYLEAIPTNLRATFHVTTTESGYIRFWLKSQ